MSWGQGARGQPWATVLWLLSPRGILHFCSSLPGPKRGEEKGCNTLGAVGWALAGLAARGGQAGQEPAQEELFPLPLASVGGEQGEAWPKHERPAMAVRAGTSGGVWGRWAQGQHVEVQLCPARCIPCCSWVGGFPPRGHGAAWDREGGQGLMSLGDLGLSREDKRCCRKGLRQPERTPLPVARKFCLARPGGLELCLLPTTPWC